MTASRLFQRSGPLILLAVLLVLLSLFVPDFLGLRNLRGLMLSVTLVGTIAATMMLVLAMREVDLSVGSTVALAGVLTAVVIGATGSVALGVLAGLAGGTLVGLFNGVVIAGLKVNSLIVTLATMEMVRGLAFLVSGGESVAIPAEAFYALGSGSFLGINWPIWVMLLSFVVFGLVVNRTVFGRNILAIGGNPEAARLAGVPVTRVRVMVFALQGLAAAVAGIVLAARITSGQPNTSMGLELAVISACVLGGVSLSGGVATIGGVIVGVLIMGAAQNALNLLNVPTFYQYLVRGGILLVAVIADRLRQGGRLPTFRRRPAAAPNETSHA
ncbi:L-arabinose ABC transporter permease AraH [Polymorphobacter fuscus]|uniref:L-arabinose ABC transporter permease AraH n=1 Tax=Sandarakinorhabdus fusca TaxID=1439888 RepID=A0A7C9GQ91_9SPHN|nr:L-arabinose ABC transporter permease AraH [Polymorphobacter fuscus]KAB7644875.1 L-arabinose ABC transporter permease AraH [Polymorphobacter fuscus]MQT18157.1 L-arabinose ABC transporter permease AraH [Polymorphobacter fuscus]NJC09475.1 L-arabinose transport system permease protein [Polymorphobacter fuscus]